MDYEKTGKVQLDGSAIRRIREERKLTQFYIAKVVGVTTDTVSRWENNRYPSVLRDNVLLLAEALEVPVEEILLKQEEPARTSRFSGLVVTLITVSLLILSAALYFFFDRAPVVDYQLSVQRLLPPHASNATRLPVRVAVNISGTIDGMVLREEFPKGFKLMEAYPPPSSLDNIDGSARWILQSVSGPILVSYLLQADASIEAGQSVTFNGELIVNAKGENNRSVVQGESRLETADFHWADANKDMIIDDGEALDASVISIAMKKVHVDWDLIEAIWDAGGYSFDPVGRKFVVKRKNSTE